MLMQKLFFYTKTSGFILVLAFCIKWTLGYRLALSFAITVLYLHTYTPCTRDWTQGHVLARQALFHWATYTQSSFHFSLKEALAKLPRLADLKLVIFLLQLPEQLGLQVCEPDFIFPFFFIYSLYKSTCF